MLQLRRFRTFTAVQSLNPLYSILYTVHSVHCKVLYRTFRNTDTLPLNSCILHYMAKAQQCLACTVYCNPNSVCAEQCTVYTFLLYTVQYSYSVIIYTLYYYQACEELYTMWRGTAVKSLVHDLPASPYTEEVQVVVVVGSFLPRTEHDASCLCTIEEG